eukprot:gb/GECG01003711.1/.p1 GENE.gb/GECG01003711.1/~~gb/GECG01003711.1/.p1  ORF type:complete len:549 (+),score=42.02 gb/GECG01003711.1/:1-1647(+)
MKSPWRVFGLSLSIALHALFHAASAEMDMEEFMAALNGVPPGGIWEALIGDSIDPVPPLPNCESTPPTPPRSDIQQFNTSFMNELTASLLNYTLGPCTSGAHKPSSTALSGAFILGGKIRYFNYGCVSKKQPGQVPTEKTIYRLASNSKTFAVETAIHAFRDGKIDSFDDELRKYFEDFHIPNPFGSSQPTFRQMMSQLSGVPREGPCERPHCNLTTAEMLDRILQYNQLMMSPWTYPSYSNLAYSIFANLISERMYGKPWSEFLVENIAKPLNMNSTGMNYTSEVFSKMVTNYLLDGSEAPFDPLGWLNPAGGVYSTSEDMALWILHYLNEWKDENSLGQLRRNMMMQIYENPGGNTGFGAPWEIFSSHGYLVRTKSGDLPGLTSFIAMVPELDFGLVFLWNGAGIGTIPVGQSVFDAVIPVLRSQYGEYRAHNFPEVSNSFLNSYLGTYYGFGMKVEVNATRDPNLNNTLLSSINLGSFGTFPLKPESSGKHDFAFRVFYRRQTAPCLIWELQANIGEWVYFNTLTNGTRIFNFPGLQFVNFTKIA